MTDYPEELDPSIMEFLDDRAKPVQIVGDFEKFKDRNEFLEEAEYAFIDNLKNYEIKDVYIGYVKWYDNSNDACVAPLDIFENGCYSWASQEGEEGAIKVYVIDL